jgi:hypothetical protein
MSPPNQPEKNACFLPVFEKQGHPQAVSGEQRCNYHLQVYLFYRQRKKKTSSILLKSSVRCRKPGPGVRHALWTEVVKKILKIGRLMRQTDQLT